MIILFFSLVSFFFLFLQSIGQMTLGGGRFHIEWITLLIFYVGFTQNFWRGIMIVSISICLFGAISNVDLGVYLWIHLASFFVIQGIREGMFIETYVTKSLWVFFLSLLIRMGGSPASVLWIEIILQALLNTLASFPCFILIDVTFEKWLLLVSKKRANLTGADLFQLESGQRRYF